MVDPAKAAASLSKAQQACLKLPLRASPERTDMTTEELLPEDAARLFHDTYERLAPSFGYETRPDTKAFDPESPNGRLMIAVCGVVVKAMSRPTTGGDELRSVIIAAYQQGAMDVHENRQEDRDPDFTEAAHDYARTALGDNPNG